jgi:hypothetical protein
MAETRTAIKITYDSGNSAQGLHAELDKLIEKAGVLQSTLANLGIGGRGGNVPNTDERSSLNSSLPMARTAPGGNTSNVVSGGTSTQGGGNQSDAAQGVFDPTMRNRIRLVNTGFYDLPAGKGITPAVDLSGFGGTLLDSPNGPYRVPRNFDSFSLSPDEWAAYQAKPKKPGLSDKIGSLTKGRGGYAAMIVSGLVAHGITSRYADYWSSMYSAAPVETSGLYAGNYFQMLQSQREAQAIRQSAAMRASWAGAQIGSTGLMGLAPMLALGVANPLIGLGLAGASMGGGIFLNMWSSKGQAAEQSRIDTQTARTLAGIQTAQARQSSSIQFASAVANLAPFNMLNQGADQIFKGRGQAVGYGAVETLGFMNSFAQAGGNLNSTLAERIPDLLRYKNIRPETLGALSRGTLPGGGIDPRFITTNPILRSTDEFMFTTSMGYANAAGIDASRINEWFQRQAAFNARYAERGLTVSPTAQTDILKSYGNPKLKGLSQAAFTENIQQFGMGVADELTESMMPKRLAQALMLQRAISNGGGPGEWYKKLSHPVMTAAIGSEVEKSLPAMLRPFFAAQVTGMVPEMATFRGGGVKPTSTPSTPTGTPSSGSGTGTGNKAVDAAIEALQITAEANNQYLQKWQTTIVMASKQLDAIQEAIRNSAGSIPVAP